MKVDLSRRELNYVMSLVTNDVKRRQRRYDSPRSSRLREAYFARSENAGKTDSDRRRIDDSAALLGRLKLARAVREARIHAKLRDAAVVLARDYGTSVPSEVGERADDFSGAYADLLSDATNAVQEAYEVGEDPDDEDRSMEWMEAAHKAGDGAATMRALLEGIANEMRLE